MRTEVDDLLAALPAAGITRATRLGLALAPQIEDDAWRKLVAQVAGLARGATLSRQTLTAWLGDALAYGGDRDRGFIAECAAAAGLDAGTLRNAKMVCARIPVSCRHDALTWTHHCEVGLAFSDPAEIERWLALAERERLSTSALRSRVRMHVATCPGAVPRRFADASVAAFRLMRELRAVGRSLARTPGLAAMVARGRATGVGGTAVDHGVRRRGSGAGVGRIGAAAPRSLRELSGEG
jgi:hypothetical protein